jgi:hypothetical protein
VAVQHVRPDDLNPMMIWNGAEGKVIRVKNRTLEYYENIRIVYQIERRLKNLQERPDASERQRETVLRPGVRGTRYPGAS